MRISKRTIARKYLRRRGCDAGLEQILAVWRCHDKTREDLIRRIWQLEQERERDAIMVIHGQPLFSQIVAARLGR